MRRTILILILVLGAAFGAFGQAAGSMDLVVVMDTSVNMSGHHWETSDYLIGPFLREFLRIGDTFHLISFAETPRMEISRHVASAGDLEIIIARLLLMSPLGGQANIGPALNFAEMYVAALPGNRPRRIILISDGSAPGTDSLVAAASGRLSNVGTDLQFIRVPVIGAGPPSGRPLVGVQPPGVAPPVAVPPPVVAQPPVAVPPVTAPPPGVQPPVAAQPPGVQPPVTAPPPGIQPPDVQPPAVAPPPGVQPPVVAQPPGVQPPVTAPPPGVQPPVGVQPPGIQPPVTQPPAAAGDGLFIGGIPLPLIIALGILLLGILGLIAFLALRNLHSSPNRTVARAIRPSPAQGRDASSVDRFAEARSARTTGSPLHSPPPARRVGPKDKIYTPPEEDTGPMMLNLFVEDQNTAIGRRNIHTAKAGQSFSIGGGKSDFLVFLVPIPSNIADIQVGNRNCTFIPRKPQYFPDIGSQSVPDCIGKTIRVISDKNYELFLRVERYEDPLKALNKLLNSISVPGEVK
ncbi:MAG: VWA domain-containing protein [Treponema sp.]|nr:VWA domain-containing protein [Treponema sp.]